MIAADDPRLAAYRQIRTAPPLADRHGEPEEGRPAWLAYVVAFRRSEMRIPIFNHRISYHRRDRHRYRWTPRAPVPPATPPATPPAPTATRPIHGPLDDREMRLAKARWRDAADLHNPQSW